MERRLARAGLGAITGVAITCRGAPVAGRRRLEARPDATAMKAAYHHRCRKFAEGGDRRVRSPEDDDQQGHTEGAPHLPGGLVDGTADGEALGMQARHRRRAQHREGEADPKTGDQCRRQPMRQVGGLHTDLGGVPDEPAREARRAHEEHTAGTRRGWRADRRGPIPPLPRAVRG